MLDRRWLVALVTLVTACAAQTAPPRDSLPDVAAVVPPARPCSFPIGPARGLYVASVIPNTAAVGVLQAGDVIVAMDGVSTPTDAALRQYLDTTEVGQQVTIEVVRQDVRETVSLTLGAGVEATSAPLVGVMIVTSYEEVSATDVPAGDGWNTPYARLALVNGGLFSLDPVTPAVVALELDVPALPWLAAGGTLYRIEGSGAEARLVGHDDREVPIAADLADLALLGSSADRLVVALTRQAGGPVTVGMLDPSTGELEWEYEPPVELGLPTGTLSDVGGDELLLGLVPEGTDQPTFQILSASDGTELEATDHIEALNGGRALGWFDEDTILGSTPEGETVLVDTGSGATTGTSLPRPLTGELRVWTVGDGVHVLVQDGTTVYRGGLDTHVVTRPVIARCDVDYIDQVGTGRAG